MCRRGASRDRAERAWTTSSYGAIGAFIGGRLGYARFYQPSLLVLQPVFPFWGHARAQPRGHGVHGGMSGRSVGAWIVIARSRASGIAACCPTLHVLAAVRFGPFGLLLGRIANFVNGELLGRVVAAARAGRRRGGPCASRRSSPSEGPGVAYPDAVARAQRLVAEVTSCPASRSRMGIARVIAAVQSGVWRSPNVSSRCSALGTRRSCTRRSPRASWSRLWCGLSGVKAADAGRDQRVVPDRPTGCSASRPSSCACPMRTCMCSPPLGLSRGQWLSAS
jgi:hypothetical protein